MYARIKTIIAEARLESGGGCDNSSGGGSSPASLGTSESDGSSSADELWHHDLGEFRRHASTLSSVRGDDVDCDSIRIRQVLVSSAHDLDDIHKHQQRMHLLLPSFASPAVDAARAEALSCWLTGFDVGWVLDMEAPGFGRGESLPRRELERRVSAWAQALSTMERVFRFQHRELTPAQVAALEELAVASTGAMLKLVGAVAALGSSPSKLLTALDLYAPVSETFPVLARLFSWGPSHPVSAAAEATLAALVDAALRCRGDLTAFIRSHYPWRMPQGGEVHPCVPFWMGYFLCMVRNPVSLHFILGNEDGDAEAPGAEDGLSLVAELILCLEAVLEEKSAALAVPGLRQVFMLNNTHAIMCRAAVGSDLEVFLDPEWIRVRLDRIEGYIRDYMDASWTPVVWHLDGGGRNRKQSAVSRRRNRNPLSAFYSAFENACSTQRCWKVPNPELRGVLRRTVAESVIPHYRRYLEDHPEVEVACGRTTEELEQQLRDLFEG
ncbi:unnamed protein product [Miscanthus lutarioriparius]|uniref:Exocyst subunit Exo70 family protein n=1 Tax=Miscanthus lutarioriparius TaxID=422564 RepID=A0A811S4G1_9POAL|nr:unnamed protein product [Miscanthus lutarioriparius]